MLDGWTAVEVEIARIVAESGKPFDPATIAHVSDFVAYVRNRCPIPEIGKGYWSTIRFCWNDTSPGPLEVEVFGDRLEIYRFSTSGQITGIRDFPRVAGEPLPPELLAPELPIVPESK